MRKRINRITANTAIYRDYYRALERLIDIMDRAVRSIIVNRMTAILADTEQPAAAQDAKRKNKDSKPGKREQPRAAAKRVFESGSTAAADRITNELRDIMLDEFKQWEARFEREGEQIARRFLRRGQKHASGALLKVLENKGFTVRLRRSAHQQNMLAQLERENAALIKTIPAEYFDSLYRTIFESISKNESEQELADRLADKYKITKERAAFIARDQNHKATNIIAAAECQELGITHGEWRYNYVAREPRPAHVAANGKVFDLSVGLMINGRYWQPGEDYNCTCTFEPVTPLEVKKLKIS